MTGEYKIPTIADANIEEAPFPETIEPFNSEWWLNQQQKEICDIYLGECQFDQRCAVQAVRTYKSNESASAAATRFFKQAKVRRYIHLRSKQLSEKLELKQEDIIRDLIEVKEMAMGRKDTPVYTVDKNGNIIEERSVAVANLPVAKQALEQLGKYHALAMWNEKTESAGDKLIVNLNFNMGGPVQPAPQPKTVQGEKIAGVTIDMGGESK